MGYQNAHFISPKSIGAKVVILMRFESSSGVGLLPKAVTSGKTDVRNHVKAFPKHD